MPEHKDLTDAHIPYAWEYADATARAAATGFVSADLGKLARQLDDNTLWMLTVTTPTWVAVGASSGGAYPPFSPDAHPVSANAMDDEFEAGSLDAKWTIVDDTSGNYAHTFSGSLINIALTSAASNTYRLAVLRQPAPAGNWRVRAKILQAPGYDFHGSHLTPIVISSGKSVYGYVMHHSSFNHRLVTGTGRFTNSTYSGAGDAQQIMVDSNVYYQELEYDGTNVIFRISIDGVFFTEFYREATATFMAAAPTGIMVGLHPYNSLSNIYKPKLSIDWFRRMA